MSPRGATCVATPKSCGTPSGWRSGGRCPKCRAAHNAETNRYRGLRPDQRKATLDALRGGATPKEAAERVGVTLASLRLSSSRDSELRMALDGAPEGLQLLAKQGDFLAALTHTAGDFAAAVRRVGITQATARRWRTGDPQYAAAENAVIKWVASAAVNARGGRRGSPKIPDDSLDLAAELLESGHGLSEAARRSGASVQGLRVASARHKRLAAALPPVGPRKGGSRSRLTADVERELRALWGDPNTSIHSLALRFNVSPKTVTAWRKSLGLPARKSFSRG